MNGSGVSINHGNVQKEAFCLSSQFNPPSDASGKSFRGNVSNLTGNCNTNTGDLNVTTVAVEPSHPFLSCNDQVYIDTIGVKTVTDTGSGLVEKQFDNFTTSRASSGITDLGNFKTFKIP